MGVDVFTVGVGWIWGNERRFMKKKVNFCSIDMATSAMITIEYLAINH